VELGRQQLRFSEAALSFITTYKWPGNVRELENLVERVAILTDGDTIEPADLPEYLCEASRTVSTAIHTVDVDLPESGVDFNFLIEDYENKLIAQALLQTQGNKKAAAKLLGLNRTTLVEKIKKKGLEGKIEVSVCSDVLEM
jgi:DNA-binding NtrC family response regulator